MAFDPPIVDNFTGSNGTIDERVSSTGPIWEAPFWGAGTPGYNAAQIVSNAVPSNAAEPKRNAVIDSKTYGPGLEVAITITQLASGSEIYLDIFSPNYTVFPATFGDGNAYFLDVFPGGGGGLGTYNLLQAIGVVQTTLIDGSVGFSGGNFSAPESIGVSLVEEGSGTNCSVWRKLAGVWTLNASVLNTNPLRPAGPWHVGFEVRESGGNTVIVDNFMAQNAVFLAPSDNAPVGILGKGAGW